MNDTSQSGYVWAPPGPYEVRRKPRRRGGHARLLVLAPVAMVVFMLFGVSYLASSDPAVTLQPGAGFATVSGKEVALLPYHRSGTRGMFQMITQDMFQVRLSATELDTGRALWDVPLAGELSWQARVLASGTWNTYVVTDGGLVILDLTSGAVLARDHGIQGLPRAVTSRAAYGYDASAKAIVAMDADGGLHTIALDAITAIPASPQVVAAWAGKLSAKRPIGTATSSSATEGVVSGGGTVLLQPRGNAPGLGLVRRSGGGGTPVGDTVFHEAQIPLTPPPGEAEPEDFPAGRRSTIAAGAPAGLVVVHHNRDVNSKERALSVVSLRTGEVTATLPTGTGSARALTSPGNRTLIYVRAPGDTAGEGLALIGLDGRATWVEVGSVDYFGNPG
ncbi:PA2928 family protein [Kibdelosporangium phytohabitans]|nr:PA2928 family protein [Kibdelosporangium phytohabitans]